MIRHYSALAKQGVGTMLTESAFVARREDAAGQLGISEEEHARLRKIGESHQEGGLHRIKLSHAGARTTKKFVEKIQWGRLYITLAGTLISVESLTRETLKKSSYILFMQRELKRLDSILLKSMVETNASDQCFQQV